MNAHKRAANLYIEAEKLGMDAPSEGMIADAINSAEHNCYMDIEFTDQERLTKIIGVAGHAISDIAGFIQHFEYLKSNYEALRQDVTSTHQRLQTLSINEPSLASGVEILAGRLQQSQDVLANIAHNLKAEKCKEVAARFLASTKGVNPNPAISVVAPLQEGQGGAIDGPETGS